ncbi:hypothetical protein FO519_009425 [Halicephalobus sp. NKZ332]|nr:hypothetical protein FO519_009425 [Halicephalobus sp. NKZ332]
MKFFYCAAVLFFVFVQADGMKLAMKGKMDKGFLKDLDSETRQKFLSIYKNKDLTKRQVEDQVEELVAGLPAEQKQKYQAFKQKKDQRIQEIKNKVASVLPTLSPEGQQLVKAVESIFENKDITLAQQREQLQEIRKNAPASAKQELKEIFKTFRGKFGKGKFGKNNMNKNKGNKEMPAPPLSEPFNQEDFDVAGVVVGF